MSLGFYFNVIDAYDKYR